MKTRHLLHALLLLSAARTAAAQAVLPDDAPPAPRATTPSLQARERDGAVTIDGRLDEAAWAVAPATTEFTQADPVQGAAPTERTEVRILFDGESVYVGARMYQSAGVSARLGRRDSNMSDSDRFAVSLDTYHDHINALRFEVNPAGVKNDAVRTGGRMDDSWDAVWDVATRVDSLGWTAEMRIPLSQLRFRSGGGGQTWGLQFSRIVALRHEHDVFAFTPRDQPGGVARYGHLEGLRGLTAGRRLELLPYATARVENRIVDPSDPFGEPTGGAAGLGMDLKYGLTSNLTLNATVNPDFGQVEQDPAEVNLSAYETRFRERRPFFVEGAGLFTFGDWGAPQLFYSRRIGARPRLPVSDAAYAAVPKQTTILGAAKLTGKTSNGWSMGVLNAVTAREDARFVTGDGTYGDALVEPATDYFVGRAQKEMREGRTTVGGIATGVVRDLSTPAARDGLRARAWVGGVDVHHEWDGRLWSFNGSLAGSRVAGTPAVILAAQRSSARYFQRPDADRLGVDSAATVMQGYSARLAVSRNGGLHWRGDASVEALSPGFEINDLGFQSRVDRISARTQIEYLENEPGPVFRQWSFEPGVRTSWNYDGDLTGRGVDADFQGELLNYWGGALGVSHAGSAVDDRFTRGGPRVRMPASSGVNLHLRSDFRQPTTVGAGGNYWWNEAGSRSAGLGVRLGLRPANTWSVSLEPEVDHSSIRAQFLGAQDDSTASSTYGTRYLYAPLVRTTVGMGTRLNLTFTPELTLELYAQPYLSTGDYGDIGQLRTPDVFAFDRYGLDVGTLSRDESGVYHIDPDDGGPAPAFTLEDGDFNYRSLRGNAVLRWEFRPGSTLFLVWQQQRSGYLDRADVAPSDLGRFAFSRDAEGLLQLRPENVFMLKVNYWINP